MILINIDAFLYIYSMATARQQTDGLTQTDADKINSTRIQLEIFELAYLFTFKLRSRACLFVW